MRKKCKFDDDNGGEGCTLGYVAEYDDFMLVTEFQLKHLKKKDKEIIEWFFYCPDCGTKVKRI